MNRLTHHPFDIVHSSHDKRLLVQRHFVDSLQHITVNYEFWNTLQAQDDTPWSPFRTINFKWTCTASYDFSDDSETKYRVRISSTVAHGKVPRLYAMNVGLVIVCSISILLSVWSLYKSYNVYLYAKRRLSIEASEGTPLGTMSWDDVGWEDKMAFFNMWHAWLISGNTMLLSSAMLSVVPGQEDLSRAHRDINTELLARSLGTFFVIFSLVKYMEHYLEFYMLVIAVRSSFIRIIKFVLMILYVRMWLDHCDAFHTTSCCVLPTFLGTFCCDVTQ